MTVPFNFATQSGNIPLSELDANFANVSVSTLTATFVTGNNQSNITNVGTLNSLSVYGNVTTGNVSTNGIVRANAVVSVNYTGTNVSVTGNITGANLNVSNLFETGNITANGNITASGNVSGGNLVTTGLITAAGNITGGNVETVNLVVNHISSSDSSYVTVEDGLEVHGDLISESLDVAGNTVMNNLTVTGNFVGTDIQVNSIVNGSSNVDITNLNGNVTVGVDGINNVLVVTSTGSNVAGTVNATGNITGGNVLTAGLISATGNVTGGNLVIPNGGKITGDFSNTVASGRTIFQTFVANSATVLTAVPSGTSNNAGLVAYNSNDTNNFGFGAIVANTNGVFLRSGNIGNAASPPLLIETGGAIRATIDVNGNVGIANITPVDTLSVGGNAYVSGNITAGNLAATNLVINHISSDDSTYVFVEDGLEVHGDMLADGEISAGGNVVTGGVISATGNVTGGNVVTGGVISATGNIITSGYFVGNFAGNITGNIVVPGSNTQVLFNTNGNADAVAGFTYSTDSNTMTVLGVVSSQGNVSAGNVVTGGIISATGNVTGGNIVTSGLITATGNVTGGNVVTGGVISATGNVTGGNVVTGGLITGNVTGNEVSATGNVTGGNLVIPNGGKITGDFSNTVASGRTIFQTSAANGISIITAVPAGTGTSSGLVAYTSSDLINFGFGAIVANTTGVTLRAGNTGSAASPPLLIETGGAIRATIDVNGNVGIANAAPVDTLSVGGNAYVSGNITGGNILTGGLISAAGNITAPNFIGNVVGNITGNLVVPGSNTQVLFNDSGLANASTAMTFNKTSNVFTISGNIVGGNISTAGNVTGNEVSATGTVTGGNVVTGGVISATGTVTGGNVVTGGVISATGTVTGGNLLIPNGGKITGDFGSSVGTGRTIFQTSVANSATILTAVPTGTSNNAGLVAYTSSDLANFGFGAIVANTTGVTLRAGNIGNAASPPLLIETGGAIRATIDVNGNVGIANITPVDTLSVSGNAYVSGKVTTLPTALANLTAVAGARAFINNANLVASGNFGTLVGSGGANTVPVWSDGSNWYIG